MAIRTLEFKHDKHEIRFGDLDFDNELEIEMENEYKEYLTIFLNESDIISLKEHIDYIVSKLNQS